MLAKLEMLIALAKAQHFGRAAQSLGITQPSLSAGIRQLEEQLGVKLVLRGARYGGLTPEGQRALIWARQIVGDTRRLREEMRASHHGLAGHLRIAVIPTALTMAARLAARFEKAHPAVSFTILSRSSLEILEMLENLDVDAGITYLDVEPLGRVTCSPLYREHYALVVGATHALAGKTTLSWGQLADVKLCLLTPNMQNRRIISRNFQRANIAPPAPVESNSTIVLIATVKEGGYATVLPREHAAFLAKGHDLEVIPIEGMDAPEIGLIVQHQEPYTPVIQALLQTVKSLSG
ncbi:LysR family transcriptional regulator [Rhodalgimonas zhirmunskyi]|uniref:LysR family transcriptional regulator n=1 Tax=Rhodalgimonas zhirmunskyi TaxID=2964767 RepID=A0AAJ1X7T9_9RHOB|nr:LysR family transcriptional regulator [Rhodoalgimonas zhirmunskyi]MDQ2095949.1 LysR family transcriptional regulator [Rhodoalgimonas zhirmunskyi]